MDFYMGQIILFAGNFPPLCWAECNGALLSVNSNTALFSILGTTYGGDGRTNFALPTLPSVKDVTGRGELKYYICTQGVFPSRQ